MEHPVYTTENMPVFESLLPRLRRFYHTAYFQVPDVLFLMNQVHVCCFFTISDVDKIMQRFLRKKPVRVTLATLLGVYRAVMRLSSIADALDDAIEEADDHAKEAGETAHEADTKTTDSQHGGLLMREFLISPLQQVA